MKVFAHRGFSYRYPENTLLAFKEALKLDIYGIELDVHKSKDGKLVIIHDEDIKRTFTKKVNASMRTVRPNFIMVLCR